MRLTWRRVPLADACAYVAKLHRHHDEPPGHRFSLGAFVGEKLVGVAMCGRPVSRAYDHERVLEVSRVCTDGTPNACSFLYGCAARAADALGFDLVQTYTLDSEPGVSLRAAGWTRGHTTQGGQHARPGDWRDPSQMVMFQRNNEDQPTCPKVRWYRVLRKTVPA